MVVRAADQIYGPDGLTTVGGMQQRTQFPNNIIRTSRLDPVALKFQQYFPAANNNLTNNFVLSPALSNSTNTGDVRIDGQFGDHNHAFIRLSLKYPFTGSANYDGNVGNYVPPGT
jgi:hypothetical protein